MFKCDICGREISKKNRMGGYTLCSKHMHQLHKYGRFLDNIPRTNTDLNDYVIHNDGTTTFNLYGQNNVKNGEFTIDTEDIEKVKYHKWRFSHNHVVTGQPSKGEQRDLSHIVLGIDPNNLGLTKDKVVVDHINGDPTNNTKENLRICTQAENTKNLSLNSNNTSGFSGVSFDKARNAYATEIHSENGRCHLGRDKSLKRAVYKRYIAEQALFGEFANDEESMKKYAFCGDLPEDEQDELTNYVINKLSKKHML